jgi:hypothetical protein
MSSKGAAGRCQGLAFVRKGRRRNRFSRQLHERHRLLTATCWVGCHRSDVIPELVPVRGGFDCANDEVVSSVPGVGKLEHTEMLKLFCDVRTVL